MAYANLQDMIDRYGERELIDVTRTLNDDRDVMNVARINRALEEASELVETYLQRRYQLPLQPIHLAVTRAVCAIARYDLCQGNDREPSEQIKAGRKDALAWLTDVASGKATLDASLVNDRSETWSRVQTRPRSMQGTGLW